MHTISYAQSLFGMRIPTNGRPLEQIVSDAIDLLQLDGNRRQNGICHAMAATRGRHAWADAYAALDATRQLTLYFGETLGENWLTHSKRLAHCTTRRGVLLRVGFLVLVRRAIRAANLPPLDAVAETR